MIQSWQMLGTSKFSKSITLFISWFPSWWSFWMSALPSFWSSSLLAMTFLHLRIIFSLPDRKTLFEGSESLLVSMLIKISTYSLGFQRKYFSFSWLVIVMNRFRGLSLLHIDVAWEDKTCMGGSNFQSFLFPALWNLTVLGVQVAISQWVYCCSIYTDVPGNYYCVHMLQLPNHSQMNFDNWKYAFTDMIAYHHTQWHITWSA